MHGLGSYKEAVGKDRAAAFERARELFTKFTRALPANSHMSSEEDQLHRKLPEISNLLLQLHTRALR